MSAKLRRLLLAMQSRMSTSKRVFDLSFYLRYFFERKKLFRMNAEFRLT